MKVLLTGGTGHIGSAVQKALQAKGHQVTALVRSQSSAELVTAAGATALIGEITDTPWLTEQLQAVDGAIHTAATGDASTVAVDTSIANAAVAAFSGTEKPYVHTSGIWVYGPGADLTEETPFDAPDITAWRAGVENIVVEADLHGAIIAPGVVYGEGKGLPNLITSAPRDKNGALHLIGDGTQHWTTVHVDDIADLYVLALEQSAQGYYIGVSGQNPTVLELASAAAGSAGVHPETADESRARVFAPLVDALLLDQQAVPTKARADLGWEPSRPSLLSEIETGGYPAQS